MKYIGVQLFTYTEKPSLKYFSSVETGDAITIYIMLLCPVWLAGMRLAFKGSASRNITKAILPDIRVAMNSCLYFCRCQFTIDNVSITRN